MPGRLMHQWARRRIGAVVDHRKRATHLPDFMEDHSRNGFELADGRERAVARDDGLAVGIVPGDNAMDRGKRHGTAPVRVIGWLILLSKLPARQAPLPEFTGPSNPPQP